MSDRLDIPASAPSGTFLLLSELIHRTSNEYARAISLASLMAARSSNSETKVALNEMINQLLATAEAHRALRPPITEGLVDFTSSLARLCGAITNSAEMKQRKTK
jgi:two-component sensor histidine kinase